MSTRRRLLMAMCLKKPRLPREFQEVEYLESTGTQYIDTGVVGNLNTKLELKISINNPNNNTIYRIFGSRENGNVRAFAIGKYSLDSNYLFAQFDTTPQIAIADYYPNPNEILNLVLSKDGFFVNGVLSRTYSNSISFVTPTSLYLFAYFLTNSILNTDEPFKTYFCKLYENNILIRHFIPCYRKSDNVAGLYDLVNGVFYTNAGTGQFIVGGDVR